MVPRVAIISSKKDIIGTLLARFGTIRNTYIITPGLYCVGCPTSESPVLVSANYKLSFDTLRFDLKNTSAWILVLDTRGVNVWCAAGKGTFSTAEILFSLEHYNLAQLVSHKKIIVPQLAATAVNGREVYSKSGFRVQFGPIRTGDIEKYLQNSDIADEEMRMVSFSLSERAVLIPVEIFLLLKPLFFVFIFAFILSGISSSIFSVEMMTKRGLVLFTSTLFGILAGAVVTPILLPWLPSRQFWIKGLLPGILAWGCCWGIFYQTVNVYEVAALFLWVSAVSSYLAMNFTGSTPFTSPSGVEYEMKRGLIYQVVASLSAVGIWISAAFI